LAKKEIKQLRLISFANTIASGSQKHSRVFVFIFAGLLPVPAG